MQLRSYARTDASFRWLSCGAGSHANRVLVGHQHHRESYAARQKMLLASMPQTEYQPASPAAESTMSPDGSFTFGAARSFSGYAPPGTDKLVLDQLLPGFVISDVQMSLSLNPALARDPWSVNFSGKTIQVNWAVGNDGQLWQSSYDLNIWVSGPVGFTSPWKTDNP